MRVPFRVRDRRVGSAVPAQMWPEMPEDEAVEIITRFVYRALNGKDCL